MKHTLVTIVVVSLLVLSLVGCAPRVTTIPATDARLASLVGERTEGGIRAVGKPGFLVYGPYMPLEVGTYRLTVKGSLEGETSPIAIIDVVSDRGERVWATRPVYANATADVIATLAFIIDRPVTDVEFRVRVAEQVLGTFVSYELVKIE
ncbi:MAG: hypothetical protein KGZ66_00395 [Selenomonadales bacterium]|nr:hypothetical protein [Selenomonadales bacterium]